MHCGLADVQKRRKSPPSINNCKNITINKKAKSSFLILFKEDILIIWETPGRDETLENTIYMGLVGSN